MGTSIYTSTTAVVVHPAGRAVWDHSPHRNGERMNRQFVLIERPHGPANHDALKLIVSKKPIPGENEVLVRNLYISVDPTHRVWMSDMPQYWEPMPLNEPIRANTIGIVEQTNDPSLPIGSYILGFGNVQDYYLTSDADPTTARIHEIPGLPLTAYLSVLSVIIGVTAWISVYDVLQVKEGETVVVSAGAGAVGSLATQLCKLIGARVITIVGTDEKKQISIAEYSADASINYKTEDILARLQEYAPEGVDCYLDLTGGFISDRVFFSLKNYSRVALAGYISGYNDQTSTLHSYSMLLHRRVSLQGFISSDHVHRMPLILPEYVKLISEGKIKFREDIQLGLENYVEVLNRMLDGRNTGKVILQVF
jgi:NADPH-dependent curcumin reductase